MFFLLSSSFVDTYNTRKTVKKTRTRRYLRPDGKEVCVKVSKERTSECILAPGDRKQ